MTDSGAARSTPGSPLPDEVPPSGGGVMRRIAPKGSAVASVGFSLVETLFAPSRKNARDEIERQRLVGETDPAPADPPADGPPPRVVARGRRGTRFSGSVVLGRRPPKG